MKREKTDSLSKGSLNKTSHLSYRRPWDIRKTKGGSVGGKISKKGEWLNKERSSTHRVYYFG